MRKQIVVARRAVRVARARKVVHQVHSHDPGQRR